MIFLDVDFAKRAHIPDPQRFAIDWVRFDRSDRWVVGDPTQNENYPVFGDDVIAAAQGRVVATREDLPEDTPPQPLANLNAKNALGNHVIQALGGGRFVLYAHHAARQGQGEPRGPCAARPASWVRRKHRKLDGPSPSLPCHQQCVGPRVQR